MNQQPSQFKRALKIIRYCTIKKRGRGSWGVDVSQQRSQVKIALKI